jgi:signal peptidase I
MAVESGEARERPDRKESGTEVGPLGHLWQQYGTLVLAIALALAIRAFVIEPFRIPSESMLPTLLVGDHLFVNKFVYGIKVPLSERRLPGLRGPRRGDVIVFTVARDPRTGRIFPADERPDLPTDRFVKRIVGLPGETIEVRNGRVYIDGVRVEEESLDETFRDEEGHQLRVVREELGKHPHEILDNPNLPGPERSQIRIPEGRYFMMGDNRDHSNDSRNWGTVRLEEIKGPAFVLYWSWDWDGSWVSLLNPVTWWDLLTQKMRWHRIGESIQ